MGLGLLLGMVDPMGGEAGASVFVGDSVEVRLEGVLGRDSLIVVATHFRIIEQVVGLLGVVKAPPTTLKRIPASVDSAAASLPSTMFS